MATTETPTRSGTSHDSTAIRVRPRRGFFGLFVVFAALALGVFVLSMLGVLPGFDSMFGKQSTSSGALLHNVRKEHLLITITEDGNVESANNVDVKCEVAGGGTILWIVEDGKLVEKGEEIVRLDQSTIEDQLNAQKILYNKARAAMIQAKEDHDAAEIAVNEYRDGTFHKEMQTVEAQIKIAMENLRSAQNVLEHTQRMTRKGFATPLQLEADTFAVQRAQLDLDAAKTSKKVLEEFTYQKTLKGLEAARDAAKARQDSEQAAFALEESRMKKLEDQISRCVIKAPQSGMAVYANEAGRRGNNEVQIEEGALVREGQALVRLPDLSKMQVRVKVHESRVDQLQLGMPARIRILDKLMDGEIVSIANQPEAQGWMSANVKEYAALVSITGERGSLKPGMTAEVEILIADLPDVYAIPISAVVEQRGKFYAWVENADGSTERRPLVIGMTNDKQIEIKDGLKEGEQVLLNPRAVVSEARAEQVGDGKDGGKPEFKKSSKGEGDKSAGKSEGDKSSASEGGGKGPSDDGKKGKSKGKRGGMADLDKDGDGKISKDEAPEQMKSFFDQLDGNKDGFLDRAEMAELRKKSSAGGGPAGGGPPGGGGSK